MKQIFTSIRGGRNHTYAQPEEVVADNRLSQETKRSILEDWKNQAIHMQESDAEGFGGGEGSRLDEIEECLKALPD